jgi:hypothetical protein
MSRKPTGIFEASVTIVCKSCGHGSYVSPRKLQRMRAIICPKCTFANEFSDDEVLKRLAGNVEEIREAHSRLKRESVDD